jgi:hypothetical protein
MYSGKIAVPPGGGGIRINHLLYMDDIKLYAPKKNHILSLLTITESFSNDIGMSFGIDKCVNAINMSRSLRKFRIYRASHIRVISEFILYATKNTNDADYLIPFIM